MPADERSSAGARGTPRAIATMVTTMSARSDMGIRNRCESAQFPVLVNCGADVIWLDQQRMRL